MAKIIQFTGWYSTNKIVQKINLNADHITTITTVRENNTPVTCINIESYNPEFGSSPIHTKLSVDEVVKLING